MMTAKVINFPKEKRENAIINNLNKLNDVDREECMELDENKLLEKYLDKIDQDRRDQENRLSKNVQLMEERVEKRTRETEERIEKKFIETMNALKETNDKINKLDEKIESTNKWIIGVCLSTILGIAAMVIAVIVT